MRDLPVVAPADLAGQLAFARAANRAWGRASEGGPQQRRQLAIEFYQSFAGLGEVLTAADLSNGRVQDLREEVGDLLGELGRDEQRVRLVSVVAPQWLAKRGSNRGVFLVGNVLSTRAVNGYYETELELKPGHAVTVLSLADPSASLPQGARAFVLGYNLANPSENIALYSGDADQVVLNGLHLALGS